MTDPVLEIRCLGKDFGDRAAVVSLDLQIRPGEIVGLVGPNGAGKTTTISMIAGLVPATRGTVRVAGRDVRDPLARAALGLVPQELAVYEALTPVENLAFFGALHGLGGALLEERIGWALEVAGLADRRRDRVATLSGGMKRRLNVAAALLHGPRLVVFDEPTVGIDPHSRNHILEVVRDVAARGAAVLYASHHLGEVESLCDRVVVLDRGAVVADGAVRALIARHGGGDLEMAFLRMTAPVKRSA